MSGTASDSPPLALLPLVCRPHHLVGAATVAPTTRRGSTSTRILATSGPLLVTADHLEVEWRLLGETRLSSRVISTIQATRRPSTTRIYDSMWRSFAGWCDIRGVTPTTAFTEHVLEFLQDCFDAGFAPNTLQRQVAAISPVLCCGSRGSLANRPLIRQFLRGGVQPSSSRGT